MTHSIVVDPTDGDASILSTPKQPPAPQPANPFGDPIKIAVASSPMNMARPAVPDLVRAAGYDMPVDAEATSRGNPRLLFRGTIDGQPATLSYHLGKRTVTARLDDVPVPLSLRQSRCGCTSPASTRRLTPPAGRGHSPLMRWRCRWLRGP